MIARLKIACLVLVCLVNSSTSQTTVCTGNEVPGYAFPHEYDCTLYYICADGFQYQLSCLGGQHFSSISLRCESPETALCDPVSSSTVSTPSLTSPTLPTTPTPTFPTTSDITPTMESSVTPTVPLPTTTDITLTMESSVTPTVPLPTTTDITLTMESSDPTFTVPTAGTAPPPTAGTAPPPTAPTAPPDTTTPDESTEDTTMPDETEETDETDAPTSNEMFDPEDYLIPLKRAGIVM
ncbi:hepatitis A virus cellular receptor 1-like [Anopheles moucheti]|uniref:hepatitis A virus cellular receptor 1-like n=1 Tax=Anopheles moucheti TaxID=186751 RepID=UPI0022F0311B|nr:hepatitis A virus cellular receptor 1-like [Anopheles moucheti]